MLEILLFVVAFVGSVLASYFDLKTTEIPDEIPYVMMAIGIVGNLVKSYLTLSYWPFLLSLIVGLGFLGFGFIMYYAGQWGGGDAKILSAIGFLLPNLTPEIKVEFFFPFPLSFFFNVFLIGAIYIILYAIAMSIKNKKIWTLFFKDLKASIKTIAAFTFALIVFFAVFGIIFVRYYEILMVKDAVLLTVIISLSFIGLFVLWKFVKAVEDVGFKKKIPVSELKVGDVLMEYKVWEGITEKDLKKIKKSGKKYVWIKEGVRFAPTFPLALLFTILVGDGIVWMISFGNLV